MLAREKFKALSIKSLSKTRWKLEPEQVTIYPYGLSYILGTILAVVFIVLFLVYSNFLHSSIQELLFLIIPIVLFVAFFFGFAGTSIEFDNRTGMMRKKFMGFIPVVSQPFSRLHGINIVTDMAGSYRYRLFKKDDRYGKGILVSCGYSKNDDPNAVAFVNEVAETVHRYLDMHDAPIDYVAPQIISYKYFDQVDGQYRLKKNKIGSIIVGLALFAVGIHELTPFAWMARDLSLGWIFFMAFTFIGGPAIIIAGLTNIIIDPGAKVIERVSPIGLGNKTYAFSDFNGLQTVRKSTNFIYSGTEVRLYFLKPNSTKEDVLALQSFYSTRKVEKFIEEVNSLIKEDVR